MFSLSTASSKGIRELSIQLHFMRLRGKFGDSFSLMQKWFCVHNESCEGLVSD